MANLEVNASSSVCRKCGRAYGKLKGYFPICYGYLYKGSGYLPYCSDCCKKMFDAYYAESGDERASVRQMCRKLDLYWHDDLYESATKKTGTRTIFQNYIARLNNAQYMGKSYDDTLREEKTLWGLKPKPQFGDAVLEAIRPDPAPEKQEDEDIVLLDAEPIELTDEIVAFWGQGLTPSMYRELEQRRRFYKEQMGEDAQLDMSTEMLLRQIAMAEVDINKARAAGQSVDKLMTSLNSMLSNLKKPQKKEAVSISGANEPFGVLVKCIEDRHPIQEMEDENYLIKYIFTWFVGPICKMFSIKNKYAKMHEDAMERLRVNRPEFDDEDDETFLDELLNEVDLDRREEFTPEEGADNGNDED